MSLDAVAHIHLANLVRAPTVVSLATRELCNGARCVANQQSQQYWELDFAGDEATGTVTGYSGPVLLVRVP